MSTPVITALRHDRRLKGNLKFTALEIGHRMNAQGYGRIAYQMMAYATGYCRRTAIRHMHRLIDMGILAKTVYKLQNGYAINLYKCLLAVPAFYRDRPQRASGDRMSSILPDPKTEEEKALSLREELERHRKGLRFLTNPESEIYKACGSGWRCWKVSSMTKGKKPCPFGN